MHAFVLDESPSHGHGGVGIERGVAHGGLYRPAEHSAGLVEVCDGQMEPPLPILGVLGRPGADVRQQAEL